MTSQLCGICGTSLDEEQCDPEIHREADKGLCVFYHRDPENCSEILTKSGVCESHDDILNLEILKGKISR